MRDGIAATVVALVVMVLIWVLGTVWEEDSITTDCRLY